MERCTRDPYETPTFWIVHGWKECLKHFLKYCSSQYTEACLRWAQECSLEKKVKYHTGTTPFLQNHWAGKATLNFHTDFTRLLYSTLTSIQEQKLRLSSSIFGKQLHGKLRWLSPWVLPGSGLFNFFLFKRGQVWHFYTDVTNVNISWDLRKIHILYSWYSTGWSSR